MIIAEVTIVEAEVLLTTRQTQEAVTVVADRLLWREVLLQEMIDLTTADHTITEVEAQVAVTADQAIPDQADIAQVDRDLLAIEAADTDHLAVALPDHQE